MEQQVQDLKAMESTLCGSQFKITETTCSLAQRVEALEAGIVPLVSMTTASDLSEPAKRWHNELFAGQLNDVAASVRDLEARFELFRKNATAQIAASTAELNKLQEENGSKKCFLTEDLQSCLVNASKHVVHLERLREKWKETQAPRVCDKSEDDFEEVVRDAILKCLGEVLPPQQLQDRCPVSLHTATSSGCFVAEEAGVTSMGARQPVSCSGKIQTGNKDLASAMHRRAGPCLLSPGEVAVEHRRIVDQALPLPRTASVIPSAPTFCDKAVSVPKPCHTDRNVHCNSQMVDALEPAPSTILPCDAFTASSVADVNYHNSSTASLSTATSISEAFSNQDSPCSTSKLEKKGGQVFQVSGSPRIGKQCRLSTLQAQTISTQMLVMSPHTLVPAKPPATLLFSSQVALPVLRCELPWASSVQPSPRSPRSPHSPRSPESITRRIGLLPVQPSPRSPRSPHSPRSPESITRRIGLLPVSPRTDVR